MLEQRVCYFIEYKASSGKWLIIGRPYNNINLAEARKIFTEFKQDASITLRLIQDKTTSKDVTPLGY